MISKRITASKSDCGCGERVEYGSSPYIGKFATLRNGIQIKIEQVDPENGRRFCGTYEDQDFWFTLKDIAGLNG